MILRIKTLGSACLVVALTCCTASRESSGQPPPVKESTGNSAHPHTNRLINETSPYLLQHAHNPVDWYPWGPAAFAKAQAENKPIFLSVGYSTCYWCHVMERESFEQEDVAKILNEHFIAIKVDREERPELDQQYMLATQLIVGRGGWPNSLWLTPDGRPWMAGTYFPRAQFKSALLQLADAWQTRGTEVLQQATSLTATIERIGVAKFESKPLSQELIDATVKAAIDRFDAQHGGFSVAPKFPPHAQLALLIDQFRRHGDSRLSSMVATTLEHMSRGGVFDQLGGGFHRYSTDQQWLLPHFEKMLYDNGQLLKSYTDGFLLTGNAEHRETVARVFQWLQRDMTSPAGGFYSAIDSESNAQEGKYYVWSYDELLSVLGKDEGERFAKIYGARPEGNFKEESTGHGTGDNVLQLQASIADSARAGGSGVAEFEEQLSLQRAQLLQFRSTRAAPTRDDKIIAAWNGLMIEGLAYAGRLLKNDEYVEAARRAADFILEKMIVDGQLHRTYRAGEVKFTGTLDDHAFVAAGLIELYRATDDQRYLLAASELAQRVLTEFDDADGGGFYFTALNSADNTAGLVIRAKNLNGGGNLPSGNGVITQVLFDLAELTSDSKYSAAARRNLQGLSGYLWRSTAAADALHIATATFLDRQSELAPPANIADAKFSAKAIAVQVFVSHQELVAGQKFTLAVQCDIDPAWHLYGPNPGAEFVQPTTLKFTDSNVFKVVDIQSPTGTIVRDTVLDQDLRVYTGKVLFRVELQVASDAPVGPAELQFVINSQACDARQCAQPEQTQVGLAVTILAGGQTPRPPRHIEIFGE